MRRAVLRAVSIADARGRYDRTRSVAETVDVPGDGLQTVEWIVVEVVNGLNTTRISPRGNRNIASLTPFLTFFSQPVS